MAQLDTTEEETFSIICGVLVDLGDPFFGHYPFWHRCGLNWLGWLEIYIHIYIYFALVWIPLAGPFVFSTRTPALVGLTTQRLIGTLWLGITCCYPLIFLDGSLCGLLGEERRIEPSNELLALLDGCGKPKGSERNAQSGRACGRPLE